MNPLNKEILRLALPSILANLTIPLVGMVDTGVAGHLPVYGAYSAAAFIGAISVGAMMFNLIYWNFGFLRTGTGGLTAQSFGRGDMYGCAMILCRGVGLALVLSVLTVALQWPIMKLALLVTDASAEVGELASRYFYVRVLAAPATMSLMVFSGWFVGMQDSVSSMWKDLVVNSVNIVSSIILSLGVGRWEGLGFVGVALGTVIAQYCGLIYCICVCVFKYGENVFSGISRESLRDLPDRQVLRGYFRMNLDLLGRSVGFTLIYLGYTVIATGFGDVLLASSSIMMQLLMIFSYFTDGFAYAGEALTGRFIGARDLPLMRCTVKYVFIWSMSIAALFMFLYQLCFAPLLCLMTSDPVVTGACREFLPWLLLMPALGCAAFTWDGIYLGATATRPIRNSMLLASVAFFAVWLVGRSGVSSNMALHLLLAAYFVHLVVRAVYLTLKYRREVVERHFPA